MKQFGIFCGLLILAAIAAYFVARSRRPDPSPPLKKSPELSSPARGEGHPAKGNSFPVDRLPLLPVKNGTSQELFRERYSFVLLKYREAANKTEGGGFLGKFAYEKSSYIRETRLLALCFPDQVEKECTAIARDPQADPLDITFAMWALRFLALKGRKTAEGVLFELATTMKHPILADDAMDHLSACDGGETYRATYWEGCRRGTSAAFSAVSYRADSATMTLAEELLKSYGEARGDLHRLKIEATTLLERQRLLISGEWKKTVTSLLEQDQGSTAVTWALQCGQVNELPGMIDILRTRLDHAEEEAKLSFSRISKSAQSEAPNSDIQFVKYPNPIGLRDKAYDEVLVAYMGMGGKLNDLEQQRLRTFGYAGDPEERLNELISGK